MTITILDGGMGRELQRSGAPFRQPECSALALIDAPDFVRQAHESFAEAGLRQTRADLEPPRYLACAQKWGPTKVGGCCGIGPEHIAALATGLR